MKYLLALPAILLISMAVITPLSAEDKPAEAKVAEMKMDEAKVAITRKVSPFSVNETMDKFESIIKKKDFDVFARIDHQKNAEGAELKMVPAQVIIFGNPKGGTLLMNHDIRVALDLPLRVAVYQDADDLVYIAYHDPAEMTAGYDLEGHKVIGALTGGLDKLTSAAIAE